MIGSMGAVVHADDTIILFDRSLLRPDGGQNTCAGTTDLNSPLKVVRYRCSLGDVQNSYSDIQRPRPRQVVCHRIDRCPARA